MGKMEALRVMGCLNTAAEKVTFGLFRTGGKFFDSHDKLQVKYEMLRAVLVEDLSVAEAACAFGYSRETYYNVARDFEMEGCVGLMDQAQGRRQPEKLKTEIVEFVLEERRKDRKENSGYRLAERVYDKFHVRIHPRTVYKVLKKGAPKSSVPKKRSKRHRS